MSNHPQSASPLRAGAAAADDHDYDPNLLLDALRARMRLDNDEALAHKLQVIQPIIHMMRSGKLMMTQPLLLGWIEESTGIPVAELKEMMVVR